MTKNQAIKNSSYKSNSQAFDKFIEDTQEELFSFTKFQAEKRFDNLSFDQIKDELQITTKSNDLSWVEEIKNPKLRPVYDYLKARIQREL